MLIMLFLSLPGCGTFYLEKNSEALSQAVYASKDSIEVARLDLTDMYVTQAARIVVPPKHKIEIKPIYNKSTTSSVKSSTVSTNNKDQRVLIVPEKYKNDKIVIVNTTEYNELLKVAEINTQLQKDNANLKDHITLVDQQIAYNSQITNELILKNQQLKESVLQKEKIISDKNSIIFKLWTGLVTLIGLIVVYFYIKFKTTIRLPF